MRKLTIHLTDSLGGALDKAASQARMSPENFVEDLVRAALLRVEGAFDDESERERTAAERDLFTELGKRISKTAESDQWDDNVSRDIIVGEIQQRHLGLYERAIGGEAYANGNPTKNRINQELGARIKAGLRAVVRNRRKGGPPLRGNVANGIIQTFTKLYRP